MPRKPVQVSPRRPWRRTRPEASAAPEPPAAGAAREYLRLLFCRAAETLGSEQEPQAREFIINVFQLSQLLQAFRRSPRGKVGGPAGVAAQLGVSRNAIYVWLDSLRLDADDLRRAGDLTDLLHQSPVLRSALEALLPNGLTCK